MTRNTDLFLNRLSVKNLNFNVVFMDWMKNNYGKTYQDAVNEWIKIEKEIKNGIKYKIGKQFEYNQYIRDFFIP